VFGALGVVCFVRLLKGGVEREHALVRVAREAVRRVHACVTGQVAAPGLGEQVNAGLRATRFVGRVIGNLFSGREGRLCAVERIAGASIGDAVKRGDLWQYRICSG
jgi:hypothetical protein